MMELQLGLALPCNDSHRNIKVNKGLDLNFSCGYEPNNGKEPAVGSGQVHSTTTSATTNFMLQEDSAMSTSVVSSRKRGFGDAFEESSSSDMPRILPLLLWNNQPNEEDDDDPRNLDSSNFSLAYNKMEGDQGDGIVGWPPIKLPRKTVNCHQNHNNRPAESNNNVNRTVDNGCVECLGRASNSTYVKVKMEGAPIARKIDLSLHQSLPALKQNLLGMFAVCQEMSSSYVLTYQDRDGDWLLAEDVSWRSFIRSVQRLKLVRNSG